MEIKLKEHSEHSAAVESDGKTVAVLGFCNHDDIPALRTEVIKRVNAYERTTQLLEIGLHQLEAHGADNGFVAAAIEMINELLTELEGKTDG